jgi:fumarate hydratase subunit beta
MAVFKLTTPISEEDIRKLKVNDTVYITGTIFTMRDETHKRALNFVNEGKNLPMQTEGLAVFHCGPIVKRENGKWKVIAAGPTTSMRMEPFEGELIKALGIRVVIGKGGMGPKTTEAMKSFGAVYGAFTGGAAVLAAKLVKKVRDVKWLDLGMPEALWVLEVENFGPLIVAIDSHGNNIHSEIMKQAERNKEKICNKVGV